MKQIYFLWLVVLYLSGIHSGILIAQVPKSLDSLEAYVKTYAPTDTNYVKALNRLGDLTSRKKADYSRADSLLRVSEKLALKLDFGLGVTDANIYLGSNYYLTDRPQQALEYLQKAQIMAEKYKLSPRMRAQTITNVGVAYNKLKQYEKAIETHLRSVRLQEQLNIQPRIPTTYEGLGLGLKNMTKPREAIKYFEQALALKVAAKNDYGAAITEHNIGRCYDDLNQEKEAIKHYKTALSYIPGTDYELLRADILGNIGLALRKDKRFQEAKPYLEQGLAIAIKHNNKESISGSYFDLGRFYEEQKDYKQAELYMKKALKLANEREDKVTIAEYTQGLADLYGGMKDFQQAYVYQLERNQRMDSATAIRTSAEVQRMVAKYETEKKEARIQLLQQQAKFNQQETERTRFRTNALLTGAALFLLLGGAVSAWLLNRAKLRRLEEAQQLRKQIAHDLHDEVGSTLSSISMLSGHTDTLLRQNQPESAQKMVQKIYTDARQILESIDEIIWTINPGNDSLQRIALRLQEYAQPLMESKNIKFDFQIDALLEDIPISMEVRRSLYLIGKEAINNLVKYSQATQATVRFEKNDNQLRVLIEDNGQGFDTVQQSGRTGQASMKQRAQAMGGLLEIRSIPKEGTRLILTALLT
ncbi:tetratricopeptide repeat-containing sensor histidine kinase [Spirosoma panaciterrae]|uniref:tetratricopeptide repeat-containing sensor histidine kinase n=1 Tax=Spirosoma panaciterrae TaxID=496058 RepID=UPI00037840E4|nr:tetratricopeptide repeat protein [Spirosoma panaciterrae]